MLLPLKLYRELPFKVPILCIFHFVFKFCQFCEDNIILIFEMDWSTIITCCTLFCRVEKRAAFPSRTQVNLFADWRWRIKAQRFRFRLNWFWMLEQFLSSPQLKVISYRFGLIRSLFVIYHFFMLILVFIGFNFNPPFIMLSLNPFHIFFYVFLKIFTHLFDLLLFLFKFLFSWLLIWCSFIIYLISHFFPMFKFPKNAVHLNFLH